MKNITCKLVTNDRELDAVLEVRRRVFVEEQGVSEDVEYDGLDDEALHVIVKDGDRVIGTARVRFPAANLAKVERMAILRPFRRQGIGSSIMSFLDGELKRRRIERAVLHAQSAVIGFYESCGFEKTGSPFWEAGIKHMEMQRQL